MRRSWILLSALALSGCATGYQKMQLTSREELAKIAAQPAPAIPASAPHSAPAEWRLTGPLATRIDEGGHPETNDWERAFTTALASAKTRPTAAMACVAHEAGVYALAHGELPEGGLLDFISGRCGATHEVQLRASYGTAVKDVTDARLFEKWQSSVAELSTAASSSKSTSAGLWFGRSGDKAGVFAAFSTEPAHLDPFDLTPDEQGGFSVSGQVPEDTESVSVEMNRGEFGYSRCECDLSVALPRFKARCVGDQADPLAWVEVMALPKNRFLAHRVARALVSPSRNPGDTWRDAPFVTSEMAAGSFNQTFAMRVNEVRGRAGLKPLQLEIQESQTAQRVAPHYFSAMLGRQGDREKVEDVIALGMMAGWDVTGGSVRSGSFNSEVTYGSADAGEFVKHMLTYPSGRSSLLDPDARLIAVGRAETEDAKTLAALTATYLLLEPRPLHDEQAQVFNELNSQRAAIGLGPAVWVAAPDNADQKAAELITHTRNPDEGTELLLHECVTVTHSQMHGWTAFARDLSRIRFPQEMLRAPKLAVVLSVGHFKSPDDPWAQYVLMFATPEMSEVHDSRTVASAE